MPEPLMHALCAMALALGTKTTLGVRRLLGYGFFILILVAHLALMRPIEVFRLRRGHTIFSSDFGAALSWVVLVIETPKNRKAM